MPFELGSVFMNLFAAGARAADAELDGAA